jgi:hypothetical protein
MLLSQGVKGMLGQHITNACHGVMMMMVLFGLTQGTDRWQNDTLFDPSDAGASGFYALNKRNSWYERGPHSRLLQHSHP